MARRHRQVLVKLDPMAVTRFQITETDIRTIERYLHIIQAELEIEGVSLWQEIIDFPQAYATSLVIHELVEIRILLARGIDLLKLDTDTLQQTLTSHIEAQSRGSTRNIRTCKNTSLADTSSSSNLVRSSRSTVRMWMRLIYSFFWAVILG